MSRARSLSSPERFRALPASIWALGFGSLLMDASSELVHSLLPIFMTSALGASMIAIGFVEGIAEATASITKLFSGVISDHVGKRKGLLVFGYGLSALPKPVFRSPRQSPGFSSAGSSIASERAFVARRAMRSSPTSRRRPCAAPPTGCANRSIPSAPLSDHCWRW
jgi:hypothetical protein